MIQIYFISINELWLFQHCKSELSKYVNVSCVRFIWQMNKLGGNTVCSQDQLCGARIDFNKKSNNNSLRKFSNDNICILFIYIYIY